MWTCVRKLGTKQTAQVSACTLCPERFYCVTHESIDITHSRPQLQHQQSRWTPSLGEKFLLSSGLMRYICPTAVFGDAGMTTSFRAKGIHLQYFQSIPSHVSLTRFQGRPWPGPNVWSRIQEGSCAEDSLSSTTGRQWKKVTREVMWLFPLLHPFVLWNLIWPVSL